MKYITVLDFEVGRVFQYKTMTTLVCEEYERFITSKGHKLNNCEWMIHENPQILTQTKEGDIVDCFYTN